MVQRAYIADAVFDGQTLHKGHALVVDGTRVHGILPVADLRDNCELSRLGQGTLAPGFVDLQVNGGAGVMLNDDPSVQTLRMIATAHRGLGTAALLPTLITDTADKTRAAIDATALAIAEGVPGIAGLHLEGPHLSVARKGAHDPALIRPMTPGDLATLLDAAQRLPSLMVTIAPETVTPEQIGSLTQAGVVVSLGHSDADFATCARAVAAGATCVTHLFNAMSQLGNREPGVVGAALDLPDLHAGLIADGIHVDIASIGIALRAKRGPGRVFLVTDAMAPAGSDIQGFMLNGRRIERRDGRLTLADGTLAGADLDMARAIRVLVNDVGVPLADALRMATTGPASVIRRDDLGRLAPGHPAHFVHLRDDLTPGGIWNAGETVKA
ncbi:MAG: N-acetylglucosamine-6-phosphate deacetylase [Rhodobacter sp.]|nr:N-acetylglucosamine-6-phosphate deacetylase [Rhodobacter sp.]